MFFDQLFTWPTDQPRHATPVYGDPVESNRPPVYEPMIAFQRPIRPNSRNTGFRTTAQQLSRHRAAAGRSLDNLLATASGNCIVHAGFRQASTFTKCNLKRDIATIYSQSRRRGELRFPENSPRRRRQGNPGTRIALPLDSLAPSQRRTDKPPIAETELKDEPICRPASGMRLYVRSESVPAHVAAASPVRAGAPGISGPHGVSALGTSRRAVRHLGLPGLRVSPSRRGAPPVLSALHGGSNPLRFRVPRVILREFHETAAHHPLSATFCGVCLRSSIRP